MTWFVSFSFFGQRKATKPHQCSQKAGLAWHSCSAQKDKQKCLEGAYSARCFGLSELQSILAELLLPWWNQMLLSADMIVLLCSDGSKWQSAWYWQLDKGCHCLGCLGGKWRWELLPGNFVDFIDMSKKTLAFEFTSYCCSGLLCYYQASLCILMNQRGCYVKIK